MRTDIVQITLDDLKKFSVSKIVLSPTRWANCLISVPLSWTTVKFDKANKNNVPERQGVYTFVVKPSIASHPECSYLLYVGKTERQNLRKRFLQYFDEPKKPKGREPIKHMVEHWEAHLWFCLAPIEAIEQIASIEKSLILAFVPPINQEFPGELGKAVKAWI